MHFTRLLYGVVITIAAHHVSGQDTTPTACDAALQTPINPPPHHIHCGTYGSLTRPKPLEMPFHGSNLEHCTRECLRNDACVSFGYHSNLKRCHLYSAPLRHQGYEPNMGTSVIHYNRHCFACPEPCYSYKTHILHTKTTTYITSTVATSTSVTTLTPTTTIYKTVPSSTSPSSPTSPSSMTPSMTPSTTPSRTPLYPRDLHAGPSCITKETTVTSTSTVTVVKSSVTRDITKTVTAPIQTESVSLDCKTFCPAFNAVNNPGFETGLEFPWTLTDSSNNGAVPRTHGGVDNKMPASGNYSFKAIGGKFHINHLTLSQSVFVCPGYAYTLSYAAKATRIRGHGEDYMYSSIDGVESSAVRLGAKAGYQTFEQTWRGLDRDAEAQMVTVELHAEGGSFYSVYADDFTFSAICDD